MRGIPPAVQVAIVPFPSVFLHLLAGNADGALVQRHQKQTKDGGEHVSRIRLSAGGRAPLSHWYNVTNDEPIVDECIVDAESVGTPKHPGTAGAFRSWSSSLLADRRCLDGHPDMDS
ncbi:MAG: hypothetical protein ACR2IV_17570 [Bryobacteraceae bacterium]